MKRFLLYTDGACSGNPGRGGIGAVILDGDYVVCGRISRGYQKTTNNRMEILAVVEAVKMLQAYIFNKYGTRETDIKVTVCSDSQLVVNTFGGDWKRKANLDLWARLDDAVSAFRSLFPQGEITVSKVRGHADDRYNNEADALAVEGRDNPTLHDEAYENISQDDTRTLFNNVPCAEPVITDVKFCGYNTPADRRVEITLSNGTVVSIVPYQGGFQQCGCTAAEAKITVSLAWKYVKWINGK